MASKVIPLGQRHAIRFEFDRRSWMVGFGKEAPPHGAWSAHLLCLAVIGWPVRKPTAAEVAAAARQRAGRLR